jgi:hypothetical protein
MSLESTRYENAKKSETNMRNYFEESRYSQIFSSQESSYLDNSTVPTYEEFLTKTNKPVIPDASLASIMTQTLVISDNQMSNNGSHSNNECSSQSSNRMFNKNSLSNTVNATLTGNSLVTDDETDSEDNGMIKINEKITSYQDKPSLELQMVKLTQTPNRILATPIKRNETPVRMKLTPRIRQEEQSKRTQPNSPCEYVIYDNKIAQTSFAMSLSYVDSDETNSEYEDDKLKEEKNHDELIINDSIENLSENTTNRAVEKANCNQIEQTKFESFKLHLSDDSDHNANQMQNRSNNSVKRNYDESHVTMRKSRTRNLKTNKRNNKRVSICGDHLSENVLKIDDTIIDEYDNELDFKNGNLVSLGESTAIEPSAFAKTEPSCSSTINNETKQRKEDIHSSSSEDRFEQCN